VVLSEKQKDGCTLREHLEAVYKATKRKPEQLEQPELPNKVKHILRLYGDLSQGRQFGFSANPISSIEIQAWLNITDRTLSNWEIQTLRAIDRAYLS
jgi:hypothetical protein